MIMANGRIKDPEVSSMWLGVAIAMVGKVMSNHPEAKDMRIKKFMIDYAEKGGNDMAFCDMTVDESKDLYRRGDAKEFETWKEIFQKSSCNKKEVKK